jgi:hypothetical protein
VSEVQNAASPLVFLLLQDWNVYLPLTRWAAEQKFMPRARGPTKDNLTILANVVEWCRERSVEPRAWLHFCFHHRGFKWPPKFEPRKDGKSDLTSESLLPKFLKGQSGLGFFRRRMAASSEVHDDAYDPNRDMTPHVEQLKYRYREAGDTETCASRQLVQTLGYHPRSVPCVGCPSRVRCAVQLEAAVAFPIVALRAGRITVQEAEALA